MTELRIDTNIAFTDETRQDMVQKLYRAKEIYFPIIDYKDKQKKQMKKIEKYESNQYSYKVGMMILIFLATIVLLMGGLHAIVFVLELFSLPLCFFYACRKYYSYRIINAMKKIDEINEMITDIYNENESEVGFLDTDHWDNHAIQYLLHIISNGRAESWKEAQMMCDEYLHRSFMEDEQISQSETLRKVETSARSAAINSGISAVNSAFNIFK